MIVRNPVLWGLDRFKLAGLAVGSAGRAFGGAEASAAPVVRRIEIADLRDALRHGVDDFMACRSDAVFLCLVYPVAGIVIAYLASGSRLLPMLFPVASGFALIGPVAALGLYEMSRRREMIGPRAPRWRDGFELMGSAVFGRVLVLALMLIAIFIAWLGAAAGIYALTLGPEAPVSAAQFFHDVFLTHRGWAMIVAGIGVGFLFAVLALAVGVVSAPMLGLAAWLVGEHIAHAPSTLAIGALVYQTVWVVAVTYVVWFALIARYSANRLSAFTFLTPLFGVAAGHLVLNEPLTPAFVAAVALVVLGLVLVNRRSAESRARVPHARE